MLHIMPTSDLKDNFAKIQDLVVDQSENVYLTQNGYGSMVIMNLDTYERISNQQQGQNNMNNRNKNRTGRKINISQQSDMVDD